MLYKFKPRISSLKLPVSITLAGLESFGLSLLAYLKKPGNWLLGACLLIVAIVSGCFRSEEEVQKRQQYARGKMIYKAHCQNCHKKDGEGFRQLYPPVNQADYMFDSTEKVPCLIKNGMKGPVQINGKEYDLPMPGNPKLTKYEIAQLMTYIYNAWDNEHPRFTSDKVKKMLERCNQVE